ncbi:MAG TPA: BCD family MFS transporter [Anaerolineae bacterium]|nr:BCD family MFS transporter [Anaerolineae bacterium]HMR67433.1 BCD family MFS transporter [Anaerolineae bacterium]
MTIIKNIRLGLLHVAVAITFVAIYGVLNRIMIHELGILATVVALLVVLPYLLSPAQIWIGQYSDTHPILGYRRTPYIVLGLFLCIVGMKLTPFAALTMAANFPLGFGLGLVAFGLWGMGYNLAVVSYLSLASDMSEESQRSRTIAVMWFMMIVSIIITAIVMGRSLDPYSEAQLIRVFGLAGLTAIVIAAIGLIGLEPRHTTHTAQTRHSQQAAIRAVLSNPQARLFFVYLVLMLVAILGQDILLEPFGAHAFGMTVQQTTQLTALWGSTTLLSLLAYGFLLSRWLTKRNGAALGGVIAIVGLLLIGLSGTIHWELLFKPGIAILGFGTGIATATNLALMLDMTTAEQAGLFIGAWGVADAASRGLGMFFGSTVRDLVTFAFSDPTLGYVVVFYLEAGCLIASLILLSQIDVPRFRSHQPDLVELAALTADA